MSFGPLSGNTIMLACDYCGTPQKVCVELKSAHAERGTWCVDCYDKGLVKLGGKKPEGGGR